MASIGKIVNGKCKEFANDNDMMVLTKETIEMAPITFQKATDLANVQPEDSISTALGKLSKLYESLEERAAFYPVTKSREITKPGTLMDGNTVSTWFNELASITGNSEMLSTSVLQKALDVEPGCYTFRLGGSSYSGTDLPSVEEYKYGFCSIYKRSDESTVVILCGESPKAPPAINYRDGTDWTGWDIHYSSGKCFIVDNLSGDFNEENLKIQIHERMKVLANQVKKIGQPVEVSWFGTWSDVTWLSGRLITSDNMYYTLFYRHDEVYLIYGHITGELISFKNVSYPLRTANAPYVKVWHVSEWTSAGGNIPSDVAYGSVMRIYGLDEPGVASVGDTQFILVAYGDASYSKLYTAYQSNRGSTTVPWTRIGGGGRYLLMNMYTRQIMLIF